MLLINCLDVWLIVLLTISQTTGLSFNRPKFGLCARWNPDAITFLDNSTIGDLPYTVFLTANNTVYVAENLLNQVQAWLEGNVVPWRTISGNLTYPLGLFITSNEDVYIYPNQPNGQVNKWTMNATTSTIVMNTNSTCYSIFIDINNTLYCSIGDLHQVIKTSLNNGGNITIVVAGTGISGSTSNTLFNPRGIFVDDNFNLYVADSDNNRIQLFQFGQLNAITVAGDQAPGTISLNLPKAVILDADGYLFIADTNNNRIVASSPNGFRCIVGCTNTSGSAPNQLNKPWSLSFDTYGNLFVTDRLNSRIQKFILSTNSCGISYHQPKLCPSATWNPDAITFADINTVGITPITIFIDRNDTVYVGAKSLNRIQIWLGGNLNLTKIIYNVSNTSLGVFATNNGDIYVDNGLMYGRVDKWTLNGANPINTMYVDDACYSLFVDTNEDLYCSCGNTHKIIKKRFHDDANFSTIIAGNGAIGSTPNMLNSPRGIFVDIKFNLYVADLRNNRIQLFVPGNLVGITVVGSGAPNTIILNWPTGIILDADGYLYITEFFNHRIVRSDPNGFRCIIGCTGVSGSASNQLLKPWTATFDSYGNLFVADTFNSRIQKFILATNSCDISYNQPKFSPCATWNPNGLTVANSSIVGSYPVALFVNSNNTLYSIAQSSNMVLVWPEGNALPSKNITGGLQSPFSVFVTTNGDVYVDNGYFNGTVNKWTNNATKSIVAMYVEGRCYGLFVDVNSSLYCSVSQHHKVAKRSLNGDINASVVVAGIGISGSASYMLHEPCGIFVDTELNLYVADCGNHRIQLFKPGNLNGTTIVGNETRGAVTLMNPVGVVLDADGYLIILEFYNHRIIKSGPNGLRCIVGCSATIGLEPHQLNYPWSLSLDSYGNIFVADTVNNRIQKFILATNSCDVSYNQPKLSCCATWNPNGITFTSNGTIGASPYSVFVNTNNTVYVSDRTSELVHVWNEGSVSPNRNISLGFYPTYGLFVTTNGDVYVDNGNSNRRVEKWISNSASIITVMYVNSFCRSLFVDLNNTLYCSISSSHIVIKRSLYSNTNVTSVVAGNGTRGSASNMLDNPKGVFVDIVFKLYVADCKNNRIQLFQPGSLNGTSIVGNGSIGTITLTCPTGLTFDADGYLFITDGDNNRVIGSGPNGFRCILGCTGTTGLASNQLYNPGSLGFDSYGNLFVADTVNNRILKFFLINNTCDETTILSTDATTNQISTTLHEDHTSIITTVIPTSTPLTSIVNQSCFAPVIILIPSISSLSSPIQFRRNQDFYISSNIQLNCNNSLSTITQWKINNCTSICSSQFQIDQTIITTYSELYIPARTLPYGLYELKLTVTMTVSSSLTSTASAYVRITPSGITANLVQFGTSMITRGHEQDLILDPGTFSVDLDGNVFNASNWKYEYYCRIYGLHNFPNILGLLIPIDNSTIDPNNPSCLSNRTDNQTAWKYSNSIHSSIKILNSSLTLNRTYQFMVYMENRQNSSIQATGYLLVRVDNTHLQMIVIGCVISTMCVPNIEFQLINPTTQVALFSNCFESCSLINNITWNIYYGTMNSSTNYTKWILFNQTIQYDNIWFFGTNTSNFTATNQLFLNNHWIVLWRFEVIYSFISEISSSALNFIINKSPQNGSCSINPLNGTTTTLFTISCPNWSDEDGIKDYSLYGYTIDRSNQMMISFSSISDFYVRLPSGNDNTSLLNLIIQIRDTLECITEFNLTSVSVVSDLSSISDLMNSFQNSVNSLTTNPIIQLLSSGNQNTVGQILTSISQQFNKVNNEVLENAVSNGIPAISISISSLETPTSPINSTQFNESALIEYNKQLNSYANIRDYLLTFISNLIISTSNSIKLQSSSLVHLTQATNQLTRSSLTIASERCYRLAQSLYSISTRISYEDVHIAVNQISQCVSNVLTAVNGPLQQRINVLDLDKSRANTFPEDYDTDLESEWSNPNLFADGNDFSWETIEKGRNLYYQKQLADKIINQSIKTISLLTSSSNIHLNIGQNLTMNTSSIFMSLETISSQMFSNKILRQIGNTQIYLPSNLNSNHQTISFRSMIQPLAPADQSRSQSNTNLSRSISISILDRNGNEIPIQSNINQPIELIIPRDSNLILPNMTLQNVISLNSTPHNLLYNLHFINISSILPISFHFEMHPLNTSLAYLFIYKFDSSPQLNTTINQIDGWSLFCPSNLTTNDIYTYFLDNQRTVNHQSIIIGLRELNSTDDCLNSTNLPISNEPFHFSANYKLRIYTSGCYYLDQNNNWQSDGLIVGSLTNHNQTQCLSTHLTTFAGGFLVLPSPINWNYVFSNSDFIKNKTIYLTIISVCIIYFLLIIYARIKDKKDLEKLGVTSLVDNHQGDEYFYEVLVFTGHRKHAGTKSNVYFILAGNDNETSVRRLADPHRRVLQRGGIDAFIMAIPKSLGLLNYIRIWHDNSGSGSSASWFLKYIIVRDLQTMEKSYFICQNWLAVEKGDGIIERTLPIAGENEKHQFSYVLSKQAYHSISEGHLWFSIFSRPPSNKFTRVQRCTCCFVLLFTAMLLNILYYDQLTEAKTTTNTGSLSFGPLYITPEQISIGIIVEILSFLPSILLIQFFRRIKPRSSQSQLSPVLQAINKIKQQPIPEKSIKTKKKTILTFPWWCLFLAYGLSLLFSIVSIFFIIVRGIEFGDLKTQKWITSLLSGFFSSILLIQPIKVISLAILFAFFYRNTDKDKEAAEYIDDNFQLEHNEEYLHNSPFKHRSHIRVNRLDQSEIIWARNQRLKEIQMWKILREILTYLTFLSLLYFITYANMNPNSFYQVKHLRKVFLNTRQIDNDYTKISTINQYWSWLEKNFIENIRAQQWYNGQSPYNLSGFMNDKSNRLIGWATMRQLRIQKTPCFINSTCTYDYSFFNEEKSSFQFGWNNQTLQNYTLSIQKAYQYQTSDELDTYITVGKHATYNRGGYVYEFRGRLNELQSNLSQLHQLGWIDCQTRAVIIQVNLYNPNSQLFTSINLLAEFLSTSSIDVQSQFQPISFQVFTSISQLICAIFYMIFIVYMMIVEIQSLIKLKLNYFRKFWSLINIGIIVCSWTSVGIYIWRYQEAKYIGDLFKQTNGFVYINLELAVYINDIYQYLLGFCCFFGTIKFVRFCRYNHRLLVFIKTLEYAKKELFSFGCMFSIVFMAFLTLFYLLFISKLTTCSSLLSTAQMLFEMTLMKFDADELSGAATFLGPFCFSLFIILVVFICMSMFLTIINENFRMARDKIKLNPDEDQQIFSFMFYKFQRWIGIGKLNEFEQRDELMRSKYFHPIEHFPEKIDQLLDALNRIYMDQKLPMIRKQIITSVDSIIYEEN